MQEKDVIHLAKMNNGIVTSKMCLDNKIHNETLKRMVNKKILEKISRGIYLLDEYFEDQLYCFQLRYPKTVFSYETALYLLNKTDIIPKGFDISVSDTNTIKKENLTQHFVSKDLINLGKIKIKTPFGNVVNSYSFERIICDLIKNRKKVDSETYYMALKDYAKHEYKDLDSLYQIGKKMNILDKVREILCIII